MITCLPKFKKCCFCIPLRRGLLAWGYIRLVSTLIFLSLALLFVRFDGLVIEDRGFVAVVLIILVLDVMFSSIFVAGAHRKSPKLLRIYYYYGLTDLVACSLLTAVQLGFHIHTMVTHCDWYCSGRYFLETIATTMAVIVAYICLQFYLILLIRSEILKLQSVPSVTFASTAGDLRTSNYDRLQNDTIADV